MSTTQPRIERTVCMAVAIGLFERMDDETIVPCFTSDGEPFTVQDVRAYLAELRAQGFQWMPCKCGNYDETGRCKGR